MKRRKEKIEEKKEEIAKEQIEKVIDQQEMTTSRYIPSKIKKVIIEEHGTRCSYPGCVKQAKTLHHTQRFALTQIHDPHFIAPLCEQHHEIAHKIDVSFAEKAASLCT